MFVCLLLLGIALQHDNDKVWKAIHHLNLNVSCDINTIWLKVLGHLSMNL